MADPTTFGWGGLRFSWGDHICAIFENHQQQMSLMVPFLAQGILAGQRCAWISPASAARAFRDAFAEAGGDIPSLETSGQLVILPDVDFYLRGGSFEPGRTLELAMLLLEDGQRQGYPAMRVAADVSWLAEGPADFELWERYEAQVTAALSQVPMVAVCQYDHRRFPGSLVLAALHTHPIVILGETVCRNPFHDSLPRERRERPQIM